MRDNSYYPIKYNISFDIVSNNTVIFSKNAQGLINSKKNMNLLFKNMINSILTYLTARKIDCKVATPVWKKYSVFVHFTNTLDILLGAVSECFWENLPHRPKGQN